LDTLSKTLELVKGSMALNLQFLRWLKKYWDVHFLGRAYDAEKRRKSSVILKPGKQVTRKKDALTRLEDSIIQQEGAIEAKEASEKIVFYSDQKFRTAPPISFGLTPIDKTYENQQRYTCNSMPEKEERNIVPKQYKSHASSREKEGEQFKVILLITLIYRNVLVNSSLD
jgi:hypothetical protein